MPIPPPSERPDLYDDFDFPDRPEGYQNPIPIPPYLQRMIDERKAAREAKSLQVSDESSTEENS